MRYLCADPVLLSLLNAPPDDEPYTEEQRERDAEAAASIARAMAFRMRKFSASSVLGTFTAPKRIAEGIRQHAAALLPSLCQTR